MRDRNDQTGRLRNCNGMSIASSHLLAAVTRLPAGDIKAGFVEYEDKCERELLNIIVFTRAHRCILETNFHLVRLVSSYLLDSVSSV